MKTSNKLLLGTLIFALAIQTTCFVIAHNVSQKKRPEKAVIIEESKFDRTFSTIVIETKATVQLIKNTKDLSIIRDLHGNAKGTYQVKLSNDTCYVYSKVEEYENVSIEINSNDVRNIVLKNASGVYISGQYDTLNVDNLGVYRLTFNNSSSINYLNYTGGNNSVAHLENITTLDISLNNAQAKGTNVKNIDRADLKKNSELTIRGMPHLQQLQKDQTSKITFH